MRKLSEINIKLKAKISETNKINSVHTNKINMPPLEKIQHLMILKYKFGA